MLGTYLWLGHHSVAGLMLQFVISSKAAAQSIWPGWKPWDLLCMSSTYRGRRRINCLFLCPFHLQLNSVQLMSKFLGPSLSDLSFFVSFWISRSVEIIFPQPDPGIAMQRRQIPPQLAVDPAQMEGIFCIDIGANVAWIFPLLICSDESGLDVHNPTWVPTMHGLMSDKVQVLNSLLPSSQFILLAIQRLLDLRRNLRSSSARVCSVCDSSCLLAVANERRESCPRTDRSWLHRSCSGSIHCCCSVRSKKRIGSKIYDIDDIKRSRCPRSAWGNK